MSQVTSLPEGAIIRRARVKRDRTSQEALNATGRGQYINQDVLATATPSGTDEEVEMVFIPLSSCMSNAEVEELIPANFRPADLWELAAVNEDDPTFADQYRNFTHWKITGDKVWRWVVFGNWIGKQNVLVSRNDVIVLGDGWWVAVVREEQKQD